MKRILMWAGATSTGFTPIWCLTKGSPWLGLRGKILLFDPSKLIKTAFPESFKIKTQISK